MLASAAQAPHQCCPFLSISVTVASSSDQEFNDVSPSLCVSLPSGVADESEDFNDVGRAVIGSTARLGCDTRVFENDNATSSARQAANPKTQDSEQARRPSNVPLKTLALCRRVECVSADQADVVVAHLPAFADTSWMTWNKKVSSTLEKLHISASHVRRKARSSMVCLRPQLSPDPAAVVEVKIIWARWSERVEAATFVAYHAPRNHISALLVCFAPSATKSQSRPSQFLRHSVDD